ncbi:hypothetical protein JX266_011375 [Neoarthrinium moseri]|uniref:uncharacterized protein n=1 Tax=Neoarthrinium moseri TaxID=1658444 RepID=UPI001FDE1876|nr:uncharacterized protein JN550_011364 [Neoarthrinium moseri]KAI1842480.1 hypothetical protein JX266_011375 [Neoarthrinium moseri]KAI1860763.1 hypothetical protein JN550_011364 [Neoarthrinium moseri]
MPQGYDTIHTSPVSAEPLVARLHGRVQNRVWRKSFSNPVVWQIITVGPHKLRMNHKRPNALLFGRKDTVVDPQVHNALPRNCRVISIERRGESFWADTGRIQVALEDGTAQSFFIKAIQGDEGRSMVRSEYESTKAIHCLQQDFVPRLIAWGTLESVPDTHFLLCEYREMVNKMPEPSEFAARLVALHHSSRSPTGKFGFHLTTYNGNLPRATQWEDSWERFFATSLKLALELEQMAKGPDPAFEIVLPRLYEKVIPRLLSPIKSDRQNVKPCLVHGDLWYANSGVDRNTGNCLVFDACCFYAHHEYEFGQCMPDCIRKQMLGDIKDLVLRYG